MRRQRWAGYSRSDSMRAQAPLLEGDRDYLKAMLAAGDARKALLHDAAEHYRDAVDKNFNIIIRYYMPDEIAARVFPPGVTRADAATRLTLEQKWQAYQGLHAAIAQARFDPDAEDRPEYERYIARAMDRYKRIEGKAMVTTPTTQPAMTQSATAPSR